MVGPSCRSARRRGSAALPVVARRGWCAAPASHPPKVLIPSPRQTGRGSGRGVRFLSKINLLQIRRNKLLFPDVFHYPNAAGSPLQRIPDSSAWLRRNWRAICFKLTREGCGLQKTFQAPQPAPLLVWRGEGDERQRDGQHNVAQAFLPAGSGDFPVASL